MSTYSVSLTHLVHLFKQARFLEIHLFYLARLHCFYTVSTLYKWFILSSLTDKPKFSSALFQLACLAGQYRNSYTENSRITEI